MGIIIFETEVEIIEKDNVPRYAIIVMLKSECKDEFDRRGFKLRLLLAFGKEAFLLTNSVAPTPQKQQGPTAICSLSWPKMAAKRASDEVLFSLLD